MLTKVPFYHGTTRNLVIGFCGLFSNIFIRNRDSGGVSQKIVNVPLAYVNKEKFMIRMQQDPGLNEDVAVRLPRMSAEITGIDYDPSRQLNKINKLVTHTPTRTVYSYTPVPYNVSFSLYTYTRTVEDNLQIMEQILPFFTPDMNLSIKMLQDPELIQDIPLILNSVNTDDQYDGSFEDRRTIITSYSFTMKVYFYGPILNSVDPENHFATGDTVKVIKKVDISITNLAKYNATIDPFEANVNDNYTINESWEYIPPDTLTE